MFPVVELVETMPSTGSGTGAPSEAEPVEAALLAPSTGSGTGASSVAEPV